MERRSIIDESINKRTTREVPTVALVLSSVLVEVGTRYISVDDRMSARLTADGSSGNLLTGIFEKHGYLESSELR